MRPDSTPQSHFLSSRESITNRFAHYRISEIDSALNLPPIDQQQGEAQLISIILEEF